MRLDKVRLLEGLRARVEADLAAVERRQRDTAAGATHAESRSEHAKDTRATEQSYLARGLAERVEALRETRDRLARLPVGASGDTIAVGSLVTLRDLESDALEHAWLVPVAGGFELEQAGQHVRTLTPVWAPPATG